MDSRLGRALFIAVLVGGALLSACVQPRGPAARPVVRPDTSRAQRHFALGEFQEAIAAYAEIAEQYPGGGSVLSEYGEMIEKIKARADRSFDSGDYDGAEKAYRILAENFFLFATVEGTLSFGPPLLSRRILECQAALSERRARQSLAAGDYSRTLDSFRSLPPDVLQESRVSAGLGRMMEELKRSADRALARKDFRAAGKAYAALRDGLPLSDQAGLSLGFSKSVAEEGIKTCRAQLTKDGLDRYRKGQLKEAISVWQSLLEFDPNNTEIRKAVDTASEQLKKLKRE